MANETKSLDDILRETKFGILNQVTYTKYNHFMVMLATFIVNHSSLV